MWTDLPTNEKGVIHLELLILAILLAALSAGIHQTNKAFERRFASIVQHRNSSLKAIRAEAPEPLPLSLLRLSPGFGNTRGRGERHSPALKAKRASGEGMDPLGW